MPTSTSTPGWRRFSATARLRLSIESAIASHQPVDAPTTWVISNHDVTRPVTRYGRDDTSFSFESKRAGTPTDQPFLNRRADAFIGRVFTLEKPIVGGNGTIGIGDTVWRISGPDCPSGSRVKVAAVDGATLRVEPATS